jgi:hypothetical protein
MKCNTCRHEWIYFADSTSPYGEHACMKREEDLILYKPEEIEDCEDYEPVQLINF